MMWDVIDLRNNLKNLEEKQGYVKWWAKRTEFDLILNKLNVNFEDINEELDKKDDLYCIFIGRSTNRPIAEYLNMQLVGRHNKTLFSSGLSAFRKTIASIVCSNWTCGKETDEFLDKLKIEIFYVDYPVKSQEAKDELDNIVKSSLEKNLYVLNWKNNNHPLAENIKNNLNELRKESKKNAEDYFASNNDEISRENDEKEIRVETGGNKMWFVTAGRRSAKYDGFKKHNFVAIGWELGDLTGKSKEDIETKYLEVYGKRKSKGSDVSQINKFINEIEIGDYIITSKKATRSYLIGVCSSDYFLSDELDDNNDVEGYYTNCRYVEWFGEIGWEDLCTPAKDIIKPKSVYQIKKGVTDEFLVYLPFFKKERRNKIYFGAPGTGKSYNLNNDKDNLLVDFKDNFERVTFHPDYTYANFVGTYKPVPKSNPEDSSKKEFITYKYVPGPFMRTLVKSLRNPFQPFILIIEEINRANVAAVFGDVFQLLDRNKFYESEYPINASEDVNNYLNDELDVIEDKKCIINKYLKCKFGEHFEKIIIPKNMFIWATMNSADQGVFPMDTAFKRRWDFEYTGINDGEDKIKNIVIDVPDSWNLENNKIIWNDLRVEINKELLRYNINEDKLIGPFFAFDEYMNKKLDFDEFIRIFENKILMYLFEDAARSIRIKLFSKDKEESYLTYFKLCEKFKNKGVLIFNERIQKKFIKDNGEEIEADIL